MADALDAQRYDLCKKKLQFLHMQLTFSGDVFRIQEMGVFHSIDALYYFLCGFEAGYGKGVIANLEKEHKSKRKK